MRAHGVHTHQSLAHRNFTRVRFVWTAPHCTTPNDDAVRFLQVLGDGSRLGTFTSSGDTLDFENWTLNAKDVSSIKLVARGLRYNDWLSITEASQQFHSVPSSNGCVYCGEGYHERTKGRLYTHARDTRHAT